MTTQEIIEGLSYNRGKFARKAVAEAISQREAITPELLHIIEDATLRIKDIAQDEEYFAHIYAMFLLAQFREERAYQCIVDFFSADQKLVFDVTGDVITEDLGRILASVCGGDTGLIYGMIENPDLDEYVRSAGLEALVVLMAQGIITREEVMTYFQSLFYGKFEREPSFVWDSLVAHSCDVYPGEVAEEIEQLFDEGLADPGFINPKYVDRCLSDGKDQALMRLAADASKTFIDNAAEIAGWACFQPSRPISTKIPMPEPEPIWTPALEPKVRKVGRNDPCPCGSGKKYKKCCLE